MEHVSFGLTHPGRVREQNEDAIFLSPELGLYVLCDGCGGQRAGDVASSMACRITADYLAGHRDLLGVYARHLGRAERREVAQLIAAAVDTAGREVYAAARADAARGGMGTTIVVLLVLGGRGFVAHAGDSRLYLLRHDRAYRLTEDHTVASRYVRTGLMTPSRAARSRGASAVTRAVGFQEAVALDALQFELVGGDVLLLCSDGLSRYLNEADLARILSRGPLDRAPEALVDAANRRGGADNISAIVVGAEADPAGGSDEVIRRLKALHGVPLFKHLSYPELLRVMDLAAVESHDAGSRILAEGGPSDRLYVSVSGDVSVEKGGRVLARLAPGSLFGEMGLVDEQARSADVVARTPARVIAIDRLDFFALLRRERTLAVKVLWGLCRVLTARLRSTSADLARAQGPLGDLEQTLGRMAGRKRPFV